MSRRSGLLLAAILSVAMAACGYHVSGHSSKLPTDLHTLAVPVFVNQSQTYRIEQDLTAAVIRELITRTHYHVVSRQDQSPDATLQGTVLATALSPVTFDSRTGRAATILVQVWIKVSLTDKKGKELYGNPSYLFREQYEVSSSPSSFFEERSPALNRLSRDFAQALVSDILEAY